MADTFKPKLRNPTIDKGLVEWVERIFPSGWHDPKVVSTEMLWFDQGMQKVVARIRLEYDRQQDAAVPVLPNSSTFKR